MTETQTQQAVGNETGLDPFALALVAGELGQLPAVATQDWAEQAAEALTGMDRWCRAAVMIAHADETGRLGAIEAVGVRNSTEESRRLPDPKGDVVSARVRLGRLTELGLPLKREAFSRGMSANADHLGAWRDGPLGRVWDANTIDRLLIGLAPIGGEPSDRCVIVLAALGNATDAGTRPESRPDARVLGALMILLSKRARLALPPTEEVSWLTDREQDVLSRLTLGRSVREIADELGRSPHTVHDHVKSLHRKLNASSRGELVARALGHTTTPIPSIDPLVVQRSRPSTLIEPAPGIARRVTH